MTDQLDTNEEAQGDQVETEEVDTDTQADQEPQKPFTEEQEQHMGSWMGRIVSRQIEDKVLPAMRDMLIETQKAPELKSPEVKDKFNQELLDMFLGGNVMGALDKAAQVTQSAKQNMTRQQSIDTDKAITTYSEDPYYKDIHSDVKSLAAEYVKEGYPVGPAVKMAFSESKLSFVEKKGSDGGANLEMVGGGRRSQSTKKSKLPSVFKSACAKDIKDGLYTDEADWMKNGLTPKLRKKYGIEL